LNNLWYELLSVFVTSTDHMMLWCG